MTENRIFEKRSILPTTIERMTAFHNASDALKNLTPPGLIMQVLRDDRTSLTEGEIEFRLWFGPIPVRWLARHEAGPSANSFQDRMIEGPLASWLHQHIFVEHDGGVELIDRITLAHKPGFAGIFSRLIFDGLLLRFLFAYRHWRTRQLL